MQIAARPLAQRRVSTQVVNAAQQQLARGALRLWVRNILATALILAAGLRVSHCGRSDDGSGTPSAQSQVGTLPPGSPLPNDSDCASRVQRSSWEPRLDNAIPNHTVGVSCSAIGACSLWAKDLYAYATKVDGWFTGTTDEILQWGACKWGLDPNLPRAIAAHESTWHQSQVGDYTSDATLCGSFGVTAPCYQSYGLLQIKASTGPGYPNTYPYSQKSTPFNVDYSLAWLRGCFDGYDTWLSNQPQSTQAYQAGDIWGCIGAWYSGGWYDSGAKNYIAEVQHLFTTQPWLQPGF